MGTAAVKGGRRNRVLEGAGWVAGISVMLAEMQFGMDYVVSHVVGQVSAILGWLSMVGMFAHQLWR
jgi:hypothetical protein